MNKPQFSRYFMILIRLSIFSFEMSKVNPISFLIFLTPAQLPHILDMQNYTIIVAFFPFPEALSVFVEYLLNI